MGKDQELLEAARNGNTAVVEKILSQRAKRSGPLASLRRGPGANVQDASGYSALHHAALNGHQEIVELLLTHEASTNILDSKGSSPLHMAAWAGNIDIVRLLLSHGPSVPNVNLTTKDHETALHCAAQYGHTEIVTLLLEHSCDPTIRNTREETALDLAAQYGRLETVELLVRTHPELIQPYSRSYKTGCVFPHTPLHLASRNGHKFIVDILLSSGVDVNIKTSGGTALHEAALCGKLDVVRTLLDAGVDLRLKDAQQNTVMDLLRQFPKHVTLDIFNTIKRRPVVQKSEDSDSESGHGSRKSISHHISGNSYENIKVVTDPGRRLRYSGRSNATIVGGGSSPGNSPIQNWECYPHRKSDATILSEELYQRDIDQISISSATSSTSTGLSSRERRLIASSDYTGSYVPMGPGSMPSPGSTGSKVSPTPPKKPPRRNLSVSPTHFSPNVSLPSPSAYEYLYLSRSGDETTPSRKQEMLRRGKSAEQYEVMKFRQNYIMPIDVNEFKKSPVLQRRKSEDSGRFLQEKREPVALTFFCDNIQVRTTNPRRKLRRNPNDRDRVYENYEPPHLTQPNESSQPKNDCTRTFVSNAYITLKSSQESLLDDTAKKTKTAFDRKNGITQMVCPLSPTNYQQPPTPDHPPPSALQAEISIHERIRPLSQECKRRSRDIETETDEELLLYPVSLDSSGSFSSSVSLSDKSVSTDNNVEEYIGDAPFAGLLKGSISQLMDTGYRMVPAERPKTLHKLKNVYENVTFKENNNRNSINNNNSYDDNNGDGNKTTGLGVDDKNPSSSAVAGASRSLSILSPFDEQEEWAKISEIMASFSSDLIRDSIFVAEMEKEIQSRLGPGSQNELDKKVISKIGQWLQSMGLNRHESVLLENGYDDLDFLNGTLDADELKVLGLPDEDIADIVEELKNLPDKIKEVQKRYLTKYSSETKNVNDGKNNNDSCDEESCREDQDCNGDQFGKSESNSDIVDKWLDSIRLGIYKETFRMHSYLDFERIQRIWEIELFSVLDIAKRGHRRRILASMNVPIKGIAESGPNMEEITADLSQLKSTIQQLKEEIREKLPGPDPPQTSLSPPSQNLSVSSATTGTLRHSHRKNKPAPPPPTIDGGTPAKTGPAPNLPIRNPSELLFGVPSTLTTKWRHRPEELVTGCVTYVANYLGSTVVKELKGTESTKKSIQKLKKSSKELTMAPDIILAISYRGVKFLNTGTQELVCEHEIRNIHCACQDADDLTHFAYITKDHISRSHYCHVFCVETMDQATEVILTLGQAFEVAYQIILREQIPGNRRGNGHTRSQSANQIVTNNGNVEQQQSSNHYSRSASISEIKSNDLQSKADPEGGKIEGCEKPPIVVNEDF